jgi:hypothetical protein
MGMKMGMGMKMEMGIREKAPYPKRQRAESRKQMRVV